MKRFGIMILLLFGLSFTTIAQSNTCPILVSSALETVGSVCAGIERNEVCYGHQSITALDFENEVLAEFDGAGDVVPLADVFSVTTTPVDVEDGVWGIALLSVQANLPNTLPGQNVTIVVFGDSELVSDVPPQDEPLPTVTLSSTGNINLRSGPGTNYAVVGTLAANDTATAIGRNEAGDWAQIEFDDMVAWVYVPLMRVDDGDVTLLPVAGTAFSPMQAFRFSSGVGQPACDEVPNDGILIQTPEDGLVNLQINGVNLQVGSTVYLQTTDDDTAILSTLEGAAEVISTNETRTVETGYQMEIAANSAMSDPTIFDNDDVQNLPLELLPEEIHLPITIPSTAIDWFETGIQLEAGQTFTISAHGAAITCAECPGSAPKGPNGDTGAPQCDGSHGGTCAMMPGYYGALAGKVGDGQPFHIGTGGTFTADQSGPLYFVFNDFHVEDNSGGYVAIVEVLP